MQLSSRSLPQGRQPRPRRPRPTGSTRATSRGSRLGVDELDRLGPPGGQYPGGQLLYQLRPIAKPFHRALAALADALAVEREVVSGFLHDAQLCGQVQDLTGAADPRDVEVIDIGLLVRRRHRLIYVRS